ARRILGDELRKEEDRLAALQKEYNNGEPERRGDERNYQRYLDRVSEMKAGIARKEADIAALKREIAKLGSWNRSPWRVELRRTPTRARGLRSSGHDGRRGAARRPVPARQLHLGEHGRPFAPCAHTQQRARLAGRPRAAARRSAPGLEQRGRERPLRRADET